MAKQAKTILHKARDSRVRVKAVTREQDNRADKVHKVAGIKTRQAGHNKARASVAASKANAAGSRNKAAWKMTAIPAKPVVLAVQAWVQDKGETIYKVMIDLPANLYVRNRA